MIEYALHPKGPAQRVWDHLTDTPMIPTCSTSEWFLTACLEAFCVHPSPDNEALVTIVVGWIPVLADGIVARARLALARSSSSQLSMKGAWSGAMRYARLLYQIVRVDPVRAIPFLSRAVGQALISLAHLCTDTAVRLQYAQQEAARRIEEYPTDMSDSNEDPEGSTEEEEDWEWGWSEDEDGDGDGEERGEYEQDMYDILAEREARDYDSGGGEYFAVPGKMPQKEQESILKMGVLCAPYLPWALEVGEEWKSVVTVSPMTKKQWTEAAIVLITDGSNSNARWSYVRQTWCGAVARATFARALRSKGVHGRREKIRRR